MRPLKVPMRWFAAVAILGIVAPSAKATTISNPDGLGVSENLDPGTTLPSSTDTLSNLFASGQATITPSEGFFAWGSGAVLTSDTVLFPANGPLYNATAIYTGSIDFNLGAGSGSGWTPTSINVFTSSAASDARSMYDFTLSYSTVANPTVFTSFLTVQGGVAGTPSEISVVFPGGTPITGIETVRLTEDNSNPGTTTSFSGFDLNATPALPAPEPGSLSLLALGALGLVGRGRRRRA